MKERKQEREEVQSHIQQEMIDSKAIGKSCPQKKNLTDVKDVVVIIKYLKSRNM